MSSWLWLSVMTATLATQSGFTSLWYRVDSRSDDPESRLTAAVSGLVEKASRGRTTQEDLDPEVLREMRRVVATFVQYADELDIEHTSKELIIDDGGQRLRIYYLDGEEHERQMPDGTRLETVAVLAGGRIQVNQKTNRGAKIFESYVLSGDGDTMTLTVRLEDKQLKQPLILKSVYTRAE